MSRWNARLPSREKGKRRFARKFETERKREDVEEDAERMENARAEVTIRP